MFVVFCIGLLICLYVDAFVLWLVVVSCCRFVVLLFCCLCEFIGLLFVVCMFLSCLFVVVFAFAILIVFVSLKK